MRFLGFCVRHFLVSIGLAIAFAAFVPGEASAGLFDAFAPSKAKRPEVPARHLVAFPPGYQPGSILVQFSQARLYYVLSKGRAISYPIATPKSEARWSGKTYVSNKKVNPPWTPTADMRRKNPNLPASVPGGHPRNPLGVRALYLGSSLYRIHGTDAPSSVGRAVSQGCIRMFNHDVADLYQRVSLGTQVEVIW